MSQGFKAKSFIAAISPYVAGKPIEETAKEYGLDVKKVVKLASNENPLGMPESAKRAVAEAAAGLARYPDGNARVFRQAVADYLGVPSDWVIAGNGSDEILGLIARTVLAPGTRCVYSQYSFSVYELSAQENGAECCVVPAKNFAVDLDGIAAAVNDATRLIFITNPNNPTGLALTEAEIDAFLSKIPEDCVVVLDEAYCHYLPPELRTDSLKWVRRYPNVLVTRTFSKAYGLAGLRAGFAVAQPALIEMMNRIRPPFNMNLLAQAAASAAVTDEAFLETVYAMNRAGVATLENYFKTLGIEFLPTTANFLLVKTGPQTADINTELLKRGVIVRPVKSYGLPDWLRISVGTAEELAVFMKAFDDVRAVLNLQYPL